jgi:protein-S-isoprenylcysteine O-methyltransferase Ste14
MEKQGKTAFIVASTSFVLCWLLFFLFFHSPRSQILFILGNAAIGVGTLLIILAMRTLRQRGGPEKEEDFMGTTKVVQQGIYALVRHPLYLGWLLIYPAAMLVSQHWVIIVLGSIGMAAMVQITKAADQELIEKFGPAYEQYMQQVPRLNLLLGIVRKLRRQ